MHKMGIEKVKISNREHHLFTEFKDLYSISFPEFEQRTGHQQDLAFHHDNYTVLAYLENDQFIGFIAYWTFSDFIYIEHFAITQVIRGQGYGAKVLNDFINNNTKIIILEIDPIEDEISAARLRFYEKCTFMTNPQNHIHPPYRPGYNGHHLMILTTQRELTPMEYLSFNSALTNIVMQF